MARSPQCSVKKLTHETRDSGAATEVPQEAQFRFVYEIRTDDEPEPVVALDDSGRMPATPVCKCSWGMSCGEGRSEWTVREVLCSYLWAG